MIKMEFQNQVITFLYGSQTGNAQEVAERLWRESKQYYFTGGVQAMDEYDITKLINADCVIFICSTTGQGEEPDNMKHFWKFLLRKNLPTDSLINLKYFVLGLGDSSYVKFNFVAKRLHKRLSQLGAKSLLPLALADDQHDLGYDFIVDDCKTALWQVLLQLYPLPNNVEPLSSDSSVSPKWNVEVLSTSCEEKSNLFNHEDSFVLTVLENERITHKNHFQDVRLIKLKCNDAHYKPGDVFYIYPKNSVDSVAEFFSVLKENNAEKISDDPGAALTVKSNCEISVPTFLQTAPVSFGQICTEYFDLSATPRRYVFSVLSKITDSELEREKLQEFVSAAGQNDLYNYCNRPRRNVVEVLRDFPHATKNLTHDLLFELLTPIKARAFSIASSRRAHRGELHLLVAVVSYQTKLVKPRKGLCSNWLAGLETGREVFGRIKSGSFKFPERCEVPVLLVGPGTGVAPFRSYLYEAHDRKQENTLLFFGCRGENADFHCRNDFETLRKENRINLICAFSRDQEHKIYVQHKIKDASATVWNLLQNKKVHVFIAGNAKEMPQSVRDALVQVCETEGQLDKENSNKYILQLEKLGQYQTETWS